MICFKSQANHRPEETGYRLLGREVPDSYNKYYGVVSSSEIHVLRIDLKYAAANFSHSTSVNKHFMRYPMGDLTAQPDWSPTGMLHKAVEGESGDEVPGR